ncbi:MAG: hypothetical protein ACI86L_000502 [Dokdonia sp.]|jgi:hypothetical protein
MKAILHKISAALMAIVLVFTTMSFSVSMHYCGDTLVNYSFTHAVDGCVMHSMATSDATGCDEVLSKKSCCSDEQWVFEGQDEVKVSWDSFSLEQPSIFEVNNFSYLNLSFGGAQKEMSFKAHAPPLIVRDIYVFDQSFLL